MSSPLDFISSEGFRKKLIVRNLTPYIKSPSRPTPPFNTEHVQSDTSVIDSPDQLIDEPTFANQLYPLNQYGNEGGYEQVPDPSALLNTKSNEGEYGYQDANIVDQGYLESQRWKPLNVFSDGNELPFDSAEFFGTLDRPQTLSTLNNQPYPTTFVPSSYGPLSILLSLDPGGSNGLLSQDSFIARLGAQTLRREFEERIAAQIRQDTIGRANVLNVSSGTDVVNILSGIVPLIEPNFIITVTANPILAAANLALRLGGSILPVSPIPGSYFDPNINPGPQTSIRQLSNAFRRSGVGRFFNRLMGGGETGTQIMFNNMGPGQRSRLFKNIDFNKFKPNYPRTFFDRVGGVLTGTQSNNTDFYIGSTNSNPSQIFSPAGEVPVNQYGIEQQSPVYGPSELAQLYEGPSREVRLGANGPVYSNGGGIEGGFTWVSPKYKGNAGKRVGIGGEITREDEDFRPSSYNSTESTERTFKEGSILDDTQRIIDSQPQGGKRLQHVGNAIDQVSKVFHDGYKELTKGSRVLRYEGDIGQEVGTEYCRVFAKDTPYLQYNDLQKIDGITTEGRRFSYSVLDKTYNLNIAPNKQEGGQDSTNLVGGINNAIAKKYMFSLENLAWRTSNTPGFSTSDLAVCERGPNGGRVMWFPPYGLTFSETVSANWNQSDFLGRPEPIYTYKNTSRGGSLTWKIVVDHPSVLNVIVNKVLGNETNKVRVDSILESFFAGCRKYDIYELAKKYQTINPNDLFQLQEAITSKQLTREQLIYSKQTTESGFNAPNSESSSISTSTFTNQVQALLDKYVNLGLYFGNDFPKQKGSVNYTTEYDRYTSVGNRNFYKTKTNPEATSSFFDTVVTPNYKVAEQFCLELSKLLKTNEKGTITITVDASCSAPATKVYNRELSGRRIQSMVEFFKNNSSLKTYVSPNQERLIVLGGKQLGEETTIGDGTTQTSQVQEGLIKVGTYNVSDLKPMPRTFNCTDGDPSASGGDTSADSKEIFTVNAMACRRAFIKSIVTSIETPPSDPVPNKINVLVGNVVTETVSVPVVSQEWSPRDNIGKRVLRALLSECDYFEAIKADTPMVFDNLKDKLKFFQPAFHSMTPEGLNTRLTFLQQCMRPGDTIPTIKQRTPNSKPELEFNNAINTSFGAPPVLVLRIGDFYNTKIIPEGLSITYEGLDLNPEGIGVQPMIANVTLSFKFVGGSGLKESIDKLQNALTFNYYANTEIYDDRADASDIESSLILDQIFLAGQTPPPIPGANSAAPNNGQNNNSTIGSIISSETSPVGTTTGAISYSNFMDEVVSGTQTYFTNVINKTKECVNQYNNAVRQQWLLERNYTQGRLTVDPAPVVIFGKPNNVEKRFDEIFVELDKNIKDGDEGFIKFISEPSKNFSTKVIRTIKENYINFVSRKRGSFQNAVSKISQDLVNQEQSYIQTLARVNILTYDGPIDTGTDGLQAKNGPVTVYVTLGTPEVSPTSTATNTLFELVDDVKKIQLDIIAFNAVIQSNNKFVFDGNNKEYQGVLVFETTNGKSQSVTTTQVFLPFSTNPLFTDNVENYPFRRVYMIVSDDVVDDNKFQTFKQQMIGNVIGNQSILGDSTKNNNIEEVFDLYWGKTAKPAFLEENNITKSFIDSLEKNSLKNFLNYTPFPKKERRFTFTTENGGTAVKKSSQENMIKGLANTTNQNTNINTWNDENGNGTGAFISKAKLN